MFGKSFAFHDACMSLARTLVPSGWNARGLIVSSNPKTGIATNFSMGVAMWQLAQLTVSGELSFGFSTRTRASSADWRLDAERSAGCLQSGVKSRLLAVVGPNIA